MSHPWSTYMRLKLMVTAIRFGQQILQPSSPTPDEEYYYKSRDQKRDIAVHIYLPKTSTAPSPVLINWHSGGFVLPLHGSDDLFCRRVADATDYIVLDATYAMAPEYPFPAALEDAEDLILSVLGKPDVYDLKNIVLCGFSAGGTLALATASNRISQIPSNAIRSLIAFYPPTDIAFDPYKKRAPDGAPGSLPSFMLELFASSYVAPGFDARDPRISPFYANPEDFPMNMLIITRGKDAIAPEAEVMCKSLKAKGKNVILKRVEGVGQSWEKAVNEGTPDAQKRDEMYELSIMFLQDVKL